MKNYITPAIFNSDGNFAFKIALLIQSVKAMHLSFASERKAFVGIVPLVDFFWFTLRMAWYVSQGRTWWKLKASLFVFSFIWITGMFSVFVILTKYLLKILATLCFSDIERFFSINVIFWSYCEPFSIKKGLKSFQKFLFFILSLVEIQLLGKLFCFFIQF